MVMFKFPLVKCASLWKFEDSG